MQISADGLKCNMDGKAASTSSNYLYSPAEIELIFDGDNSNLKLYYAIDGEKGVYLKVAAYDGDALKNIVIDPGQKMAAQQLLNPI